MKTINTEGITYIDLVPYGTEEWYYGISYEHGDLYEAEEVFRDGHDIEGRSLILIHYPDGGRGRTSAQQCKGLLQSASGCRPADADQTACRHQ